jgi:hypothetical protein
VTQHDIEEKIQDFLDGRLSEAERAAMEERIAGDPELARRVEAHRDIGRALRSDPAEIPPGFYARARARFEESSKPRFGWHRVFSWEAAGLAAAGLLLAAILVPGLVRDRIGSREASRSIDYGTVASPEATKEIKEKEDDETEIEEQVRLEETVEKAVTPAAEEPREKVARTPKRRQPEKRSFATEVAGTTAVDPDGYAEEEKRGEPRADAEMVSKVAGPQEADLPASRPTPSAGDDKKEDPLEGKLLSSGDAMLVEEEAQRVKSPAPLIEPRRERLATRFFYDGSKKGAHGYPVTTVPLAPGTVPAGTFQVIEDPAAWRRFRDTTPEEIDSYSSIDFSRERVLLVGPGDFPLACDKVNLFFEVDRILVGFAPAGAEDLPSPGGCAVFFPAGPESIEPAIGTGRSDEQ